MVEPLDRKREGRLLEPHDCVVSKLVARRPKDLDFASGLLTAGMIDAMTLAERIEALPECVDPRVRSRLNAWVASERA